MGGMVEWLQGRKRKQMPESRVKPALLRLLAVL